MARVGGVRVTAEVKSPGFDNADYLFREAGVIAELKVLELDRSRDKNTQTKVQNLYDTWIHNREPVPLIFGKARLSTTNLPAEQAWQLVNIFREPVRQALKKANKQIKETKEHFGLPDAKGLVLLVNESNVALEPGPMAQMIWQILDSQRLSGITSLVYLTINLHASAPWTPVKTRLWVVMERSETDGVSEAFLDKMHKALVAHLTLPGEYTDVYSMSDPEAMLQMKHAKKEI